MGHEKIDYETSEHYKQTIEIFEIPDLHGCRDRDFDLVTDRVSSRVIHKNLPTYSFVLLVSRLLTHADRDRERRAVRKPDLVREEKEECSGGELE